MNKLIVPKIVAELTVNHIGSKHIVTAMMLSAKENGADYIKLKLKNVKSYYSSSSTSGTKKWRNFEFQTYRSSLELTFEDLHYINSFAISNDIKWFSTIHDIDSLNLIRKFKVPFYKIASMDIDNSELLDKVIDACIEDDVSLILSLGGQDFSFFENLYNKVAKLGINTTFLHTVSIYPTPIGRSNIAFLLKMSNKILHPFIKIGYSGHETGFAPSILSVLYGATMIERHFTLSDDLKIHHIRTALNPSYFRLMTQVIKDFVFEYNSDSRDIDPEEFIFLKDKIYK